MSNCPFCGGTRRAGALRCSGCGLAAPIMGGQTPGPTVTNPGQRFNLGYLEGQFYAIWDRNTSQLVQQFALTDEGWAAAWTTWQSWESSAPNPTPAVQQAQPQPQPGQQWPGQQQPQPWPGQQMPAQQQQWPGQQQPQWPGQQVGGAMGPKTNPLALTSLIVGIAGLVLFWLYALPPIAAIVLGFIGKNQIDRSGGTQGGQGMAIAGMATGGAGILFFIIFLAAYSGGV